MSPLALRWPWPAVLTWLAAWAVFVGGRAAGLALPVALLGAALLGLVAAASLCRGWRRVLVALGFPAAVLLQMLPAPGVWAVAGLVVLLVIYPPRAWRDAPLFPTPRGALQGLPERLGLPPDVKALDAGCGVGDALNELARVLPQAELHGIEGSVALRWLAALRLGRRATITGGDLWTQPWGSFGLVYLFQRPETMPRAWAKACAELRPGSWLVSLDFAVPDQEADLQWICDAGRPVFAYCVQKAQAKPAN